MNSDASAVIKTLVFRKYRCVLLMLQRVCITTKKLDKGTRGQRVIMQQTLYQRACTMKYILTTV